MSLYLTTIPWFYGGQYYAADPLNPLVISHAGEPYHGWYPLDREAEAALLAMHKKLQGMGVTVPPPHKLLDASRAKLPDPIYVEEVKVADPDPAPFLGIKRATEPGTMREAQGPAPVKRPSDVEPTQVRK
jgi:hypothetical protein